MDAGPIIVFRAAARAPCAERALVLGTQGIPSDIQHDGAGWALLVRAADADAAREQLTTWEAENADWPPRPRRVRYDYANAWPGVVGYVAVVLGFAVLSATRAGGLDWFGSGKVHAGGIMTGEWWRAVTALTLHLDLPHLAGNLFFGGVFGYAAGRYFGSGLAWLAIVVAGALGNALNSALLPASHTAVGASTAIFGALGMVSAFIWRHQTAPHERWARRLGPLVAGVALLAYTGIGGERTDVGAHLTGFLSGFVLGVVFALALARLPRGPRAQGVSAAATIALLALAWRLALA